MSFINVHRSAAVRGPQGMPGLLCAELASLSRPEAELWFIYVRSPYSMVEPGVKGHPIRMDP